MSAAGKALPLDLTVQRQASIALAVAARAAHLDDDEALQFLDMLGLPPCVRPLRDSRKNWGTP